MHTAGKEKELREDHCWPNNNHSYIKQQLVSTNKTKVNGYGVMIQIVLCNTLIGTLVDFEHLI